MPDYGSRILAVLDAIVSEKRTDYNGFVFATYSLTNEDFIKLILATVRSGNKDAPYEVLVGEIQVDLINYILYTKPTSA